ncbi:MAG TPA: class I SAM-dependent methyltransferase [Planctomicrobium sp.]|nr:class I SAM-dependent methyltransferase [Planctomicrobium sp.]
MVSTADEEIQLGQRYSFGKNWTSFLSTVDDARIEIAVQSLRNLLGVSSLIGKRFLDVGSGSGLFSLAARKLGAKVTSFDFDPASVACAEELRSRFDLDQGQDKWTIMSGSALDAPFLNSLGQYDVVYSWGVLHHTGHLWRALDLVTHTVSADGLLAIAIYNDQGWRSRMWKRVKEIYCSGESGKFFVRSVFYPWFTLRTILVSLIRRRNEFAHYRRNRGMSILHDWDDWLGGLPFEVATFQQLIDFYARHGFEYVRGKETRRLGCHELVFQKKPIRHERP